MQHQLSVQILRIYGLNVLTIGSSMSLLSVPKRTFGQSVLRRNSVPTLDRRVFLVTGLTYRCIRFQAETAISRYINRNPPARRINQTTCNLTAPKKQAAKLRCSPYDSRAVGGNGQQQFMQIRTPLHHERSVTSRSTVISEFIFNE